MRAMNRTFGRLFVWLAAWALGALAGVRAFGQGAAEARYLIVTTEAARAGFEELAAFRASPEGGGYSVGLLTVEEIHATRPEALPEARIRAAIREAYLTRGTQFVVLGARAEAIPPVRVQTPVEGIANGWTARLGTPSDGYYACLEGEAWPLSETGLCLQSAWAAADLTAKVHLGRIPAADAESAARYVRRLRRYLCAASPEALQADRVLLSGLRMSPVAIADWSKAAEGTDGYPWIGEAGHAAGAVDSELWLRNCFLSRVLPYAPAATVDLFFPGACSDPAAPGSFTEALDIDTPEDFDLYLAQRPEFMALSSHGLPNGVVRLRPLSAQRAGNAWGILYTVGCNTAQFDLPSLANGGKDTGMALPEEGGCDGQWRLYSLAEHTLLGGERTGGLVYIGSTREGYRIDRLGGIGGKSYEYLAAFAEGWAKGGKTLGEIFTAHKQAFLSRATRGADEASLFAGTTFFGDPALRPLREEVAARTQQVSLGLESAGTRTVHTLPVGLSLAEAVPEPVRAGYLFLGWADEAGEALSPEALLSTAWKDRTLHARWQTCPPEAADPLPETDPALLRESFDGANGTCALKGRSLAPARDVSPISRAFTLGEEPLWLTVHLRHEPGFENDETRGVALALVGSEHRVEFCRRMDVGYSLYVDGTFAAALPIPLSAWVHLGVRLSPEACEVFLQGEPKATLPGLGAGAGQVVFGGSAAGDTYRWASAGTLFLDEALLFAAPQALEGRALAALHTRSPGVVPLRRLLPEGEVWQLPEQPAGEVALLLSGTGTLAVAAGGRLPPIASRPLPAIRLPEGAFAWTTPENLQAMGWGMLAWEAPAEGSAPSGWQAFAEPTLRVEEMAVEPGEMLCLRARVSSALPVAFTPAARFTLQAHGTADTSVPQALSSGGEVTLRVPLSALPGALFRLRAE